MGRPDPRTDTSQDGADLTAMLLGLTGDPLDAEGVTALVPYLSEAGDAADALLTLDLDGIEPEIGFDPSWPEEHE